MPDPNLHPITPWLSSKRNLAKRICAIIHKTPHRVYFYIKPFVGMGGVFLRRKSWQKAEVINKKSQDVANLFRIVQRHYDPFIDLLRFQVTSRTEFERQLKFNPDTLTDLERAVRFLYLQRISYGGKISTRTFGFSD